MRRLLSALGLGCLLALALALASSGHEPRRFADSEGYLFAARQPLGADFFASARPPFELGPEPAPEDGLYRNRPFLIPLLFKLCDGDPARIVAAQRLLYSLAAGGGIVLLSALGGGAPTVRRRLAHALGGALLLPLALAWYVAGWTGVLLSEATVLALIWLAAGGVAAFLAGGRRLALGVALAAAALLLAARDSAGLLVLPLFALAAAAALFTADCRRARALALALSALLPLFLLAQGTVARGQRALLPIANVLLVRVAPDPEALAWWVERGLPWSDRLEPFRGRFAFERDLELFRDPAHAHFLEFVERGGRGLLLRFLLGHPGFVARETWRGAADLFGTELATYVGPSPRTLAPLDRVVRALGAPGAALVLVLFAVALARRRPLAPADLAPFVLALAFLCHGLAAYHADAAEPERHCFPTAFGLQLAAAVAVTLAVARGGRRRTPPSPADAA